MRRRTALLVALAFLCASAVTAAPGRADPMIAAAGDIACATSDTCRQQYTSDLIYGKGLAAVLPLGDNQYETGSLAEFKSFYDPTWGRVKSITRPAVGNHEYGTPGASGYFDYFGAAAGPRGKGYYSYNVGDWHIVALNSNCSAVGGCESSSPQGVWLQNDLATYPSTCTLAYWHHPLYSSGWASTSSARPFWEILYAAHADVVLNGHDHIYERFAPQDPYGNLAFGRGIRQFTVGTGGAAHHSAGSPQPNSRTINDTTFGVLRLILHPTSYDFRFVPEAGQTFTEARKEFPCR